jgi:hypothetical protein
MENTQGQEPIVSLDDVIGGPFAGGNSTPDTGTNPTPNAPTDLPPSTPPQPIDTGNQDPPTPPVNTDPPIGEENFDAFVSRLTNPTEDDKESIDGILDVFKGANLDTKGNILNDKGEIVLSAEKLKAYVDEEALPLDDKGNMVNDKGEILQTALQLLQQDSLVHATKSSIETNFGISFPEGYEVEDTEDGLIAMVNDAVAINNQNSIRSFLDASPTLKSFYQHLVLGGTPESFSNSNVDYRSIDVLSLNPESKMSYIKEMFRLQGNENPDAFLDVLKTAAPDVLNKNVASAILYLDKHQASINESREQQIIQQRQQAANEDKQYWEGIKNVVTKGKLNEVTIPVVEREKFYQYLASPVEDGRSQDMIDSANDSQEFDVMVSYLRYKKYDISKLAANISREQKATTLKDRFNKYNRMKTTSGTPRNVSSRGGSGSAISLDDIVE